MFTQPLLEGKRCLRRKANAQFVGNPHIVVAAPHDHFPSPTLVQTTFPIPLPPYLPRTIIIAHSSPPFADPVTANAGRFSLGLKGMRRNLRRAGPSTRHIVREVECELLHWLQDTGGELDQIQHSTNDALAIGTTGAIFEISRTPLELIWSIPEASFVRFVVHCCARYHNIVSFSKETGGQRLTHLLRPNVWRPDHQLPGALDTPPPTDYSYSSQVETDESDSDSPSLDGHESSSLPFVPPQLACIPGLHDTFDNLVTCSGQEPGDTDTGLSVPTISRPSQLQPMQPSPTYADTHSAQLLSTQLHPGISASPERDHQGDTKRVVEIVPLFYDYLFS